MSAPGTHHTAAALFGKLRALRCRAQSLSDFAAHLGDIVEGLADPSAQASELSAAVKQGQQSFGQSAFEVDRLLREIVTILESNDKLSSAWADGITTIQAQWEKTAGDRLAVTTTPLSDPPHRTSRLKAALDEIVYQCCEITVPERIRDHLKLLPIGAMLNFREGYLDELRSPDQRRRFLEYLALYPGFVAGLVDVKKESILRASDSQSRRAMSTVWTVVIALGGFGAIALACWFGGDDGLAGYKWFTWDNLRKDLLAYAFLLLGSITHVAITLLKQDRVAAESPQYLAGWILRVHVRETSYFLSAFSLWFGAAAMAFLFQSGVDLKTAFFLGYSYDSFMDLFLKRFESSVPAVSSLIPSIAGKS